MLRNRKMRRLFVLFGLISLVLVILILFAREFFTKGPCPSSFDDVGPGLSRLERERPLFLSERAGKNELRRQKEAGSISKRIGNLISVEVISMEEGKEKKAPHARVTVALHDNGPAASPLATETPGKLTRIFECDSLGRVLIPFIDMAGKSGKMDASFLVRASLPNKPFSSPFYRIGFDRWGRLKRFFPRPGGLIKNRLRICLFQTQAVTVSVVDKNGRAVPGVPVGLFNPMPSLSPLPSQWIINNLLKGKTGKDGRCLFLFPCDPYYKKKMNWLFAGFDFPLGHLERWFRKVEKEHFQGRVLELKIPPLGSLQVVVEKSSRNYEEKKLWVWFQSKNDPARPWETAYTYSARQELISRCKQMEGGELSINWIGLGQDLDVLLIEQGRWRISRKRIHGPAVAGERILVSLPLPERDPVISGTLFDPKGLPLKNSKIAVFEGAYDDPKIESRSGHLLQTVKTDGNGVFILSLPPTFHQGDLNCVRLVPWKSLRDNWPPFCIAKIPGSFSEGVFTVGELRLENQPVLAHGIVVDNLSRPIPGVEILCYRPEKRRNRRSWHLVISASAVTGSDGLWSINGVWQDGEMKIIAAKQGLGSSRPVYCAPQSKGLRLVIARTGAVSCRVILDKKHYLPRGMIKINLIPRAKRDPFLNINTFRKVLADGTIKWSDVQPGVYDLFIYAHGGREKPVVFIPWIKVEAGKSNHDPRIQMLDLRGKVEEVKVIARDKASGKILDPAYLWIDGSRGSCVSSDNNGLIILKKTGAAPAIQILYTGYHRAIAKCDGTVINVLLDPLSKGGRGK